MSKVKEVELHADCEARIRELEEENANLKKLTMASELLARSPHRENVLAAVETIAVDLIGVEELVIFDVVERSLHVAKTRGIDETSPRLARALGPLCAIVTSGQTVVAPARCRGAAEPPGIFVAAVPLRLDGCVTGVLAVFRLAERKAGIDAADRQLFDLLSRQAAMALHRTVFRSLPPTVRPPPRR